MSDTNHLRDVKPGDVIVTSGCRGTRRVIVESVGREYVLGWQTMMQAEAARAALRAVNIDVGYTVGPTDVLRAYHALRREFVLANLPALETFIVPE